MIDASSTRGLHTAATDAVPATSDSITAARGGALVTTVVLVGALSASAPAHAEVDYGALGTPVSWEAFEAPFIGDARQLTSMEDGFRRAGEGYFSPEGDVMVFQAERDETNPFFQIFLMDLSGGDVTQVSPGTGKTTCSFLRPGTDDVLFGSTHRDPEAVAKQQAELEMRAKGERRRAPWDYDPHMDIYTAKRDGSGLTALTTEMGYDAEAAYSPDGSKIVYSSTRQAYPIADLSPELQTQAEEDLSFFGEIYLMDADGKNVTRLTDWDGYDGGPFFTPDGERIVWRHFDGSGRVAEVYTMKLDGSDRRKLTSMGAMSWAPYFHPSGEYCIYTTNLHGYRNFELYIVDPMGEKAPVRVTTADAFDGLPVFTPDGTHLCWTASRTPNRQGQLFMASWDHAGALEALANAPVAAEGERATAEHSSHGHAGH